MNIRTQLDTIITQALADAGAEDAPAVVKTSARPEFGDYQANGIMGAAKKLKMNPRELATKVVEKLKQISELKDLVEKFEIAGPGFINIHLKNSWLVERVEHTLNADNLAIEKTKNPDTVVIDYSAPNLAKEMHVGHLRSTIIGDAISRVLEFLGRAQSHSPKPCW